MRSGERRALLVDGTLRRPLESLASALSSVARYFTSFQLSSWSAERAGMPITLPLM